MEVKLSEDGRSCRIWSTKSVAGLQVSKILPGLVSRLLRSLHLPHGRAARLPPAPDTCARPRSSSNYMGLHVAHEHAKRIDSASRWGGTVVGLVHIAGRVVAHQRGGIAREAPLQAAQPSSVVLRVRGSQAHEGW